jgi:site-specific DNA recombinase
MKRAAVYARISKSNPDVPKVAAQVADCRQLAAASGYEITDVFIDDGISGSTFADRPSWNQLIADISAHKFDVVLAVEEERFTRQPREKELFALACIAVGTTWHTVRGGPIDPATTEGEFISGLMGLLARREVRRKSDRQRSGNAARRSRGEPLAGVRPFGFYADRVTHRPLEADCVRWATDRILNGGSLRSIFMEWNRKGILTSRGNPWSQNSVKKMLLRPRNAGLIDVQGEIQSVKGNWLPLVSLEDWQHCTEILTDKNRAKPHKQQKWLCSGLVNCAVCGSSMCSGSASDRKKTFHVYRCSAKLLIPDGRRHPTFKADKLDELVRNEVVKCFLYGNTADIENPDTVDATRIQARLIEIKIALAELTDLVGTLPIVNIRKRAKLLNVEELDLNVQLEECARKSAAAAMIISAKNALWSQPRVSFADAGALNAQIAQRFDSLSLEQKRALVRSLLKVSIGLWYPGMHAIDRVEVANKGIKEEVEDFQHEDVEV